MKRLIIPLIAMCLLALPSCGLIERVVCSTAGTIEIRQDPLLLDRMHAWGYARWHCNSNTTIEIYSLVPRHAKKSIIIHELIHAYPEWGYHSNDPDCFIHPSISRRFIYPTQTFADVPPCELELKHMRAQGKKTMKVLIYGVDDNEWTNDVIWCLSYWNYWLGHEAFTFELVF